jgi:hypothetical protein
MSHIRNIELLTTLAEEDRVLLELAALVHKQNFAIIYKVLELNSDILTISVKQYQHWRSDYYTSKQLADIAKSMFRPFFPDHQIHTRPYPFTPKASS